MKKIILLTVSICLFGCGASRKAIRTNVRELVEQTQTTHIESQSTGSEQTTIITDLSEGEEVSIEVVEYDTSRPVDPDTGTPPVKRKEIQIRRRNTELQQIETSDKQIEETCSVVAEAEICSDVTMEVEVKERKGLNTMQKTLCGIGVFTVIALLTWAGVKLYKRF